jgi:hypothetical protein
MAPVPARHGEQLAQRMDPVALPGGVQDLGHSGPKAFVRVRDHELHAARAARVRRRKIDRGPNPDRSVQNGSASEAQNREAEGLASTVGVDGDGNYHRDRDDPAGLAHLHIGSVAATRNGRIIGPRLQSLSRIPTPI